MEQYGNPHEMHAWIIRLLTYWAIHDPQCITLYSCCKWSMWWSVGDRVTSSSDHWPLAYNMHKLTSDNRPIDHTNEVNDLLDREGRRRSLDIAWLTSRTRLWVHSPADSAVVIPSSVWMPSRRDPCSTEPSTTDWRAHGTRSPASGNGWDCPRKTYYKYNMRLHNAICTWRTQFRRSS